MTYEPWQFDDLIDLTSPHPESTVRQLADKLGRPPNHLVTKAHELGVDLSRDGDTEAGTGGASTTGCTAWFVADHYVVHVSAGPKVYEVLARHDVLGDDVYRLGVWGFAARLPAGKAEQVAADPDVIEMEPDTADRLAPQQRLPAESRVPGHYVVGVRRTCHPSAVAARVGVVPEDMLPILHGFAAELTDAQVLTLRRDPDVTHIGDELCVTID